MGKEKVKKFSIDGGYLIYDFTEDGTVTSTAYLKQMRKEKKAGIEIDETNPVAKFKITKPDEFKCSDIEIELLKEVDAKRISEFVKHHPTKEEVVFERCPASYMEGDTDLARGLRLAGFEKTSDENFYEMEEELTNFMAIYMSLGCSMGLLFGSSTNMGIGMCMGLCIGLALGGGLDATHKKEREDLKKKRANQE